MDFVVQWSILSYAIMTVISMHGNTNEDDVFVLSTPFVGNTPLHLLTHMYASAYKHV